MPLFQTTDLIDKFGEACASCEIQFRQFGAVAEFSGRVRTIKCYEDNTLLRRLLSEPGKGSIVVVDGAGSLGAALIGDQMAELAVSNSWAGVVIFGCVRDSVALKKVALGVKAIGTNPKKSGKDGIGSVDVPVSFGGVTFKPGQWVYCDDDGVIVSDRPLRDEH